MIYINFSLVKPIPEIQFIRGSYMFEPSVAKEAKVKDGETKRSLLDVNEKLYKLSQSGIQ